MAIRLISDLHLDESRPEICRAFFDYLDRLPNDTEALYILGDLFEAWIGDDDDLTFHDDIRRKLKQTVSDGLAIFFSIGNRDVFVGKGFELQTGCILLPEEFVLDYQQQQYLLMHGDSLCTLDTEYMAFRQYIRATETQAVILAKSLEERRELVKQMREKSRDATQAKAAEIVDVTPDEVEKIMAKHHVTTLIHGHTHRPAVHTLNNHKKRIVLGDWHASGWEVVIQQGEVTLKEFAL